MIPSCSIVIVHYRMPSVRLADFFAWNDELFARGGVSVIVVSDVQPVGLPPYARAVIYPVPLERFCLAATANYGIRAAGEGIVCKTDVDCVFSARALYAVRSVVPGMGACLPYLMAESHERREQGERWSATKGTLALHYDDWCKINGYDERQDGYGFEDGDAFCRAQAVAKIERPAVPFWHIAHDGGVGWNRRDGFNPLNREQNRATSKTPWKYESWGTACMEVKK